MKKLFLILAITLTLAGCAQADANSPVPEEVETVTTEAITPPAELTDAQIEELKKSCVTIYADFGNNWSQGTAVAVANDKYLTAYHAAQENFTNIRTKDGIKFTLGTFDAPHDIATLIPSEEAVPVKTGDVRDSRVGDEVIIIGSPGGEDDTVIRTTIKRIGNVIVVDGATGSGSSGGGVFNMKGELIGIVVSGIEDLNESYAKTINDINKTI
jgi:hypothetical protein